MTLRIYLAVLFVASSGVAACSDKPSGEVADSHPPPAIHLSKQAKGFMQKMASMPAPNPVAQYEATRGAGKKAPARPERWKIKGEYNVEPVDTNSTVSYWITSPEQTDTKHVILFVHGGAYIFGNAAKSIELPLRLGRAAGMKVLSVSHRLAPEDPWPAALNDCLDAYAWLIEQGYAPENIAWAGISSGGGLVLSMANAAKIRGIPLPAAIYSMSALADLTLSGDSHVTIKASDHFMGHADMQKLADMYVGDADPYNPTISPVYGDLSGLPPTLIEPGSREIIVSDSILWARKARDAGVDVTLDIWDGQGHGFQVFPMLPEAQQAVKYGAAFLKSHLDN